MVVCHSIADFRLNILSLDDLASNITSEIAVLKQKVSRNSILVHISVLPSFGEGWRF